MESTGISISAYTGHYPTDVSITGASHHFLSEVPGNDESVMGWAARKVLRHPIAYGISYLERVAFVISMHPFLFLFAGASLWISRDREEVRQLGLLSAYFIAIYCLLAVIESYFIPLWPLLLALAASLIPRVWRENMRQQDPVAY
ncbi:MAG: hypothetical protein IIA14_16565, partial [SAR324 cluster bacterium]|nr:hypothetical protein [SAR324 cluster bacterium]